MIMHPNYPCPTCGNKKTTYFGIDKFSEPKDRVPVKQTAVIVHFLNETLLCVICGREETLKGELIELGDGSKRRDPNEYNADLEELMDLAHTFVDKGWVKGSYPKYPRGNKDD